MNENQEMFPVKQFIVIDDDNASLFMSKIFISKEFKETEITTYLNPQKAVDYFKTHFNLLPVETVVILDINMPEMTGWEVLEEISILESRVKEKLTILLLSSSIDIRDRQKAASEPLVSGYLEKPLNIQSLKNILTLKRIGKYPDIAT